MLLCYRIFLTLVLAVVTSNILCFVCNFVVSIGASYSVILQKLLKPVLIMLLAHYINFSVHIMLTVMACIVSVDRIWYFTSHIYEECSVSTNFGCCTSIYYHNIFKYQPAMNRQKLPFLQIIICDQDKCPAGKLAAWFPRRKILIFCWPCILV